MCKVQAFCATGVASRAFSHQQGDPRRDVSVSGARGGQESSREATNDPRESFREELRRASLDVTRSYPACVITRANVPIILPVECW